MLVFETRGWGFNSSQVLQISKDMRYVSLFLFLMSCNYNDCRLDPNATVQPKIETRTDSKTADSKVESKSIVDQVRDLRDGLQPGAQFRCKF